MDGLRQQWVIHAFFVLLVALSAALYWVVTNGVLEYIRSG